MIGKLNLAMQWCPVKVQLLLIGAIAVFGIFIIAKLIILVKEIIFNWL